MTNPRKASTDSRRGRTGRESDGPEPSDSNLLVWKVDGTTSHYHIGLVLESFLGFGAMDGDHEPMATLGAPAYSPARFSWPTRRQSQVHGKPPFVFCARIGAMNRRAEIVARASRPCDSCDRHTGETPVPLPRGSWRVSYSSVLAAVRRAT